ncbi:hypothetical protein [Tessaracoccus sp. Z1128]
MSATRFNVRPADAQSTVLKPTPGKGRRKAHLYWIADGDAARAMGLGEALALCRRAWVPLDSPLTVTASLLSDGSVVTDNAPDACRVCDSMYKAWARRYWGNEGH